MPTLYQLSLDRYVADLRLHFEQLQKAFPHVSQNLNEAEDSMSRDRFSRRRGLYAARIFLPLFVVPYFLVEDWVDTVGAKQTRAVLKEAREATSRRKVINLAEM
jgi:hypothetical protein